MVAAVVVIWRVDPSATSVKVTGEIRAGVDELSRAGGGVHEVKITARHNERMPAPIAGQLQMVDKAYGRNNDRLSRVPEITHVGA